MRRAVNGCRRPASAWRQRRSLSVASVLVSVSPLPASRVVFPRQRAVIGDRTAANADAAFELHRVLNRDAAASDAVGAAAHRVVVQRRCRANRHGASQCTVASGDRRSAATTDNRPEQSLDECRR